MHGQTRVVRVEAESDDEHRDARRRDRRVGGVRRGARARGILGQRDGAEVAGGALAGRTARTRVAEALVEAVRQEDDDVVAAVDRRIVGLREDAVDEVVVGVLQRAGERRSGRRDDDVAGVLLERVLAHVRGRRVVADDRRREAQQPLDGRRRCRRRRPAIQSRGNGMTGQFAAGGAVGPGTGRSPSAPRRCTCAIPPQSCEYDVARDSRAAGTGTRCRRTRRSGTADRADRACRRRRSPSRRPGCGGPRTSRIDHPVGVVVGLAGCEPQGGLPVRESSAA